jgi:integrase/recombinase XerC
MTWYKYFVRHYVEWLNENRYTYDSVKLLHLQMYLAHLREDYSPNSVKQTATALITFYRWCLEVELLTADPTVNLKRPKVPDVIQPVAARSYVQHMLNKIKLYTWLDYRDKLIIQILFCTGLRISECACLRVQDVNLEERRLAIIGKGGKLRYQPFPTALVKPLKEWLERWRPPIPGVEWLFFSATPRGSVKGPITKQAIYDTMRRRAEDAALDWVPPHGYRRGFAKDMLKHGASTRLIQKLLGHASIQTTEKYLELSPDEIQQAFDDFWEEL